MGVGGVAAAAGRGRRPRVRWGVGGVARQQPLTDAWMSAGRTWCPSNPAAGQCDLPTHPPCPPCAAPAHNKPPPTPPPPWQHLCPAASGGFTKYESFCVGNASKCAAGNTRCGCNPPLASDHCNTSSQCFQAAAANCSKDPACLSFALSPCDKPPSARPSPMSWATWGDGSGERVFSADSTLYAKPSPPPPPPTPPPMMVQPAPPWTPRSPCVDETDCALNGACSAGRCKCGSGWTGPACETLDRLPAPTVGAYGYAPNRSSWGSHGRLRAAALLSLGDFIFILIKTRKNSL